MFKIRQLQSILSLNAQVITALQHDALSLRDKARALKLERNAAESDDTSAAMTSNINRFYRQRRKLLNYATSLSHLQIEAKRELKIQGIESRTAVRSVKPDSRIIGDLSPSSVNLAHLAPALEVMHHPV